ncbi:MAG: hypothetical protein J6M17_03585 [Ruminococcus sp.]|nr:hypothetical protein [Ruminococcus sp.]
MKKSTAILIFAAAVCLSSCGHDIADFKPVSEPERASSQEVIDIPESDTDDSADTPADAPDDVPAEPENGETPDESSGEDEKPEEKESKENKDSSSKESSSSKVLIKTGVWWATSESDDFYYEVQKDGGGMMLKQEDGLGWAVQYKQKKPEKITMAFANGITQKADIEYISDDKIKVSLDDGSVETWTYQGDMKIKDFKFYSTQQLINMASLYHQEKYGNWPNYVESKIDEQGWVIVEFYDDKQQNVIGFYAIDRQNGKGNDGDGNDIDFSGYAD